MPELGRRIVLCVSLLGLGCHDRAPATVTPKEDVSTEDVATELAAADVTLMPPAELEAEPEDMEVSVPAADEASEPVVTRDPEPEEPAVTPAPAVDEPAKSSDDGIIGLGNTGAIGKGGNCPPKCEYEHHDFVDRIRHDMTIGEGLESRIVWKTLGKHPGAFRACYSRHSEQTKPVGKIALHVVIGSDGKVVFTEVSDETSAELAGLGRCFAKAIARISFPPTTTGELVDVIVHFKLSSKLE